MLKIISPAQVNWNAKVIFNDRELKLIDVHSKHGMGTYEIAKKLGNNIDQITNSKGEKFALLKSERYCL